MKNSKFARILKRLVGEELGATMMEYVILAVMIAAAVTAAAIYFGNSAKNQMQVAGDAMVGETDKSGAKAESSRQIQLDTAQKSHTAAQRYAKPADETQKAE